MDSEFSADMPPTPPKTAGRKKIKIQRIEDSRNRQVTFLKRKNGLLKKAMELGILCDCEVSVIIFNLNNGKLFEYSSVEPEKVLQKYATYSGPSERRKKDRFFELAASKGTSNIPVNEPHLAQAAMEAAAAAVRRPRPVQKFSAPQDGSAQDQYYNGRKLSSGESPGNLPVHPELQQNSSQPHYHYPPPPAMFYSSGASIPRDSAVRVQKLQNENGAPLRMEFTPQFTAELPVPPLFTPHTAGRQLSAAFGLPTPRPGPELQSQSQPQPQSGRHLHPPRHQQVIEGPSGAEPEYADPSETHLNAPATIVLPSTTHLPRQGPAGRSDSTRLESGGPPNDKSPRSPEDADKKGSSFETKDESGRTELQDGTSADQAQTSIGRKPSQRVRPNLTVIIPNSNRENQYLHSYSALNTLSSPSSGNDPFRDIGSARFPGMSPLGNTTWPPWNVSNANERDSAPMPLTPFMHMDSFGGGGDSINFGFGSGSHFTLPSPTDAGLIPLTPRFLGIELPHTARPDAQMGDSGKRNFDFAFGPEDDVAHSTKRI